ncbi:NAD(P)/FAD-dependent oxidoreductase [Chloroflexota bacterium]
MSAEVDVVVIGAGVVGLAIATKVAQQRESVFVLEKNHTFGLETSSRNSEVIHAGIYYPEDSLKARFCVEGKDLLYDLCERHDIACNRLGKIVLAINEDEVAQLEKICEQGMKHGVDDLTLLSRTELRNLEPNIEGKAGLLSPSTGIIDSHALQKFFYSQIVESGGNFIFNTEVIGIEKAGMKYEVQIKDRDGISTFITRVIINSAGLESDNVAKLAGIDIAKAGYKLHYCKGEYFSLNSKRGRLVDRLIYPTPEQSGLGVHVTLALDGRVRLGPNVRYIEAIDYRVDDTEKEFFYQSVKKFLPLVELEDLDPEFAGIRPKLQVAGEAFRDFVITHEEKAGLPGLINLIGIESPGLTASPAIARYVGKMVEELLS